MARSIQFAQRLQHLPAAGSRGDRGSRQQARRRDRGRRRLHFRARGRRLSQKIGLERGRLIGHPSHTVTEVAAARGQISRQTPERQLRISRQEICQILTPPLQGGF